VLRCRGRRGVDVGGRRARHLSVPSMMARASSSIFGLLPLLLAIRAARSRGFRTDHREVRLTNIPRPGIARKGKPARGMQVVSRNVRRFAPKALPKSISGGKAEAGRCFPLTMSTLSLPAVLFAQSCRCSTIGQDSIVDVVHFMLVLGDCDLERFSWEDHIYSRSRIFVNHPPRTCEGLGLGSRAPAASGPMGLPRTRGDLLAVQPRHGPGKVAF
jgi:hypothetical protein